MASYVTPQPLQQISPSGKKIGGDPSSQKFATTEVSSDPLISLVDIVTDRVAEYNAQLAEVAFDLRNQLMRSCQTNLLQNATFKKTKESVRLHAFTPQLLPSLEQGACTSTKRKTLEVEEIDLAVSTTGARPSGKKLIKTVARKTTAKKPRVIKATPDASINEITPLVEELNDATTLSSLIKSVGQQKQVLGGIIEAQQALEAKDRWIA